MTRDAVTCEDVVAQDFAARYAARALSPAQEEAFEVHFLNCERCQLEIEFAVTARDAVRRSAPHGASTVVAAVPKRLLWLPWLGAVAAAAVTLLVVVRAPGTRTDPVLAELGALDEPPMYLGIPVRSSRADSLFAQAMGTYLARDYRRAATQLRAVIAVEESPAAQFFLGSSLLVLDRPAEAVLAYDRVIAIGRSPYRQEAHLYRGKALLRMGRRDAALLALQSAAAPNAVGRYADSLARRVREVPRR